MINLGSQWNFISQQILLVVGTYWLHSTLLLANTAIMSCVLRLRNHALIERLWKFAAVAPLITAPIALWIGLAIPGNDLRWLARLTNGSWEATDQDVRATAEPEDADQSRMTVTIRRTDELIPNTSMKTSVVAAQAESSHSREESNTDLPAVSDTSASHTNLSHVEVTQHAARKRPAIAMILSATLALVAAVGGVRVALRVAALWRELIRCQTAPNEQSEKLQRLRRDLGIRKPIALLTSPNRAEPIACGWLQWRIVIPERCAERLTEREWTALLTHEMAHLARGDTWWLLVGGLLCNCLPFQPLNFVARRRWGKAAEFLSDEWAVSHTADPFSLASCLTRIAEWRMATHMGGSLLVLSAAGSSLLQRVERLVSENWETRQSNTLRRWFLVFAGIGCFASLAAVSPLTPVEQPQETPSSLTPVHVLPPASVVEHSTIPQPDDPLAKELAEIEANLARCTVLANQTEDEEIRILAEMLSERTQLLKKLVRP